MAFPTKDALLVPYSTNFLAVLGDHNVTYDITTEQVAAFSAVHGPYVAAVAALDQSRAQGVRSEVERANRDAAKKELLKVGRFLYAAVAKNPDVSDGDKIQLGVHVRDGYTPHPIIMVAPSVVLGEVRTRTVSMRVADPSSETGRGRAPGATGYYLYTFVGEDYPSDPAAWSFQGTVTKSIHHVTFPDSLPGGTRVWVMAAWLNSKQQSGPPSLPVSTYLQGGGTTAATQRQGEDGGEDGEMKIAA